MMRLPGKLHKPKLNLHLFYLALTVFILHCVENSKNELIISVK